MYVCYVCIFLVLHFQSDSRYIHTHYIHTRPHLALEGCRFRLGVLVELWRSSGGSLGGSCGDDVARWA